MSCLREPVHYGQNHRVALRRRETRNKIEGTNSGWRSPAEGRLEVLEIAQTEQAKTKVGCHEP